MNFTKINLWFTLIAMVSIFASCKKENEREMNPKGEYAPKIQSVATCTFTIPLNQSLVDAKQHNIGPGSVVCLEAGTRGPLLLRNFVGSATNPIIFVNKGGKVIIKNTGSYGMKVENSKYLKFTGTGSSSHKYGIEVDGPHIGISFDNLTTNLELEYTEIHNIGFAGVMCKTDPNCNSATWRDNFVMRDIVMHHNYIYKTGGEGFYIGNSFYAKGRSESCGTVYPHSIENVTLYDNIVRDTDAEGIQVGCVIKGCKIYNNTVENFGQDPFANYQNNGIQIGEGTGGLCYNNIIKNGPGNGMVVLGLGDNIIFNNIILNSGSNGIFIDERYTPGPGFKFFNNTIINSGDDGMRFYSEQVSMNHAVNNIIIKSGGKPINTNSGVRLTQSNNFTSNNIADVKFVNATSGDYKLQAGSPAVDAGANLASYGVSFDYTGAGRPAGSGFDIGAFEYGATGGNPGGSDGGSGGSDGGTGGGDGSGGTTTIKVVSLTLINAETEKDIMTMTPGQNIDFAQIGTSKINIRANTSPSTVGSIIFGLDGNNAFRTETMAPYALHGDGSGGYNDWTPSSGSHTVTATPYTESGGKGIAGTPLSITFTVGSSGGSDGGSDNTGIKVVSLTLINAETGKDIMNMTPGQNIDFAKIGTSKVNIRANTSPATVGSIVFGLDGNNSFRTETWAPYALHGDGNGGYNGWTPSTGAHSVSATPYSEASGKGTAGTPLVINFTVGTSGGSDGGGTTTPVVIKTSDDAFLQSGTRYNHSVLRVENGRRTAYMKFTVANSVNSAKLRFKVEGDDGNGNLKVGKGSHSNWTENTLSSTTAPSASWFTSSNQTWTIGKVYEIDVTNAISGPGTYTIILTMDSGNDFSFSSKEGAYAPELVVQ